MNQLTFSLLLIAFSLVSCSKDSDTSKVFNQTSLLECHQQETWNAGKTRFMLMGKWEWTAIGCLDNLPSLDHEEYHGLTVNFKEDNTVVVKENGYLIQISDWEVVEAEEGFFKLRLSPYLSKLDGRILICNRELLFHDSYQDGCDNYFERSGF